MGNANLGEVEITDGKSQALSGVLNAVDSYNPALYLGGILRLHYARALEMEPWLDIRQGRRWVADRNPLAGPDIGRAVDPVYTYPEQARSRAWCN
jgi:hypothetical protein